MYQPNTDQFRRHSSGGIGLLQILKIYFILSLVVTFGLILFSAYSFTKDEISISLIERKFKPEISQGNDYRIIAKRQQVEVVYKIKDPIQWLLLPKSNRFDLFTHIVSFLISWQLFQVCNALTKVEFFERFVLRKLQLVNKIILASFLFFLVRYAYVFFTLRSTFDKDFTLFSTGFGFVPDYLSWGSWILILLFTNVYRKGLQLRQEQLLTI